MACDHGVERALGFLMPEGSVSIVEIFRRALGYAIERTEGLDLVVNHYHTAVVALEQDIWQPEFFGVRPGTPVAMTPGRKEVSVLVTVAQKRG